MWFTQELDTAVCSEITKDLSGGILQYYKSIFNRDVCMGGFSTTLDKYEIPTCGNESRIETRAIFKFTWSR